MGSYRDQCGNIRPDDRAKAAMRRRADARQQPVLDEVLTLFATGGASAIANRWSADQRHSLRAVATRAGREDVYSALNSAEYV